VERGKNSIRLIAGQRPQATDVFTQPYPGFPTDMQAQFMALMTLRRAPLSSRRTFLKIDSCMLPSSRGSGADISIQGKSALVRGTEIDRSASDGH